MGERVRIKPVKKAGRDRIVPVRQAEALVRLGLFEYVRPAPAPAPATEPVVEGYAAHTYRELREMVAERGLSPSGRLKADLVAALEADDEQRAQEAEHGRYFRRDLRAEE